MSGRPDGPMPLADPMVRSWTSPMSGRPDGPMPLAAYATGRCIDGLASSTGVTRGRLRRWPGYLSCQFDSADVCALLYGLQAGEHGFDNADERCATPRARGGEQEFFLAAAARRGGN